MQIFHNSRDESFRAPKGAVKTGENIKISLFVKAEEMPRGVALRLFSHEEKLVSMEISGEKDGGVIYSAKVCAPESPCLLWYYFVISFGEKEVFYGNNHRGLGGEGEYSECVPGRAYQITVYDKEFKTPDWFKSAIMYQIFPDRFFRAKDKQVFGKKGEYKIHESWYEDFFNDKHPFEDGPACNDFYGGNLSGIREKLGYLKDLGISVIYLNPIFEAFSNHRYDTGDYSKIDPILGTKEDFSELCREAKSLGIRIILDGVFSHTGSDSIYFNKYGTYGENEGAKRDKNSPYFKWYQFGENGDYKSWWGCSNLPNVNELESSYVDYILKGEDAIIKKWLRLGASGWRLDVADELPDEFIKILRTEAKKEDPESVIIGEVWEDASNKESYGKKREYLFGYELDGVMNYPFRESVIGFLLGVTSAKEFEEKILSLFENYPKEALFACMNILGTHDTARIKTELSGEIRKNDMTYEEKKQFTLSPFFEELSLKRMRLAAFIQMTFFGVPSIYYGDEIGMQGLSDPFNRRPYDWRHADIELLEYYKTLTFLRNENDCLKTGDFEMLFADKDVIVYKREIRDKKDVFGNNKKEGLAICCINRGAESQRIEVLVKGYENTKLKAFFKGDEVMLEDGKLRLNIEPYGKEVFFS